MAEERALYRRTGTQVFEYLLPEERPGEQVLHQAAGNGVPAPQRVRCALYTRISTEEGLDQEFNSVNAQREAAQAYIAHPSVCRSRRSP